MEASAFTKDQLEQLASRLAWSRVLPGLALLAVGITQPVATINRDDEDGDHVLSLTGVVGERDELRYGTLAATFAVLVLIGALTLAVVALSAVANRTERSRQVTIGLAVLVVVLGLLMVVAVGSADPVVVQSAELSLSAQGTLPLLLGAVAVWVAASRAKRPARLADRPMPEWPATP